MSHKFQINTKVKHYDRPNTTGVIVGFTTLGEVVDGDCSDSHMNLPWYKIHWNEDDFIGQESENSLVEIVPNI